jgi:hypothetical protein
MCGRFKAGFEFREIKVRWQIFNDLDFTPRADPDASDHCRARRRRRSAADALGLGALLGQGSGDR